jgi:hypothetical protein
VGLLEEHATINALDVLMYPNSHRGARPNQRGSAPDRNHKMADRARLCRQVMAFPGAFQRRRREGPSLGLLDTSKSTKRVRHRHDCDFRSSKLGKRDAMANSLFAEFGPIGECSCKCVPLSDRKVPSASIHDKD